MQSLSGKENQLGVSSKSHSKKRTLLPMLNALAPVPGNDAAVTIPQHNITFPDGFKEVGSQLWSSIQANPESPTVWWNWIHFLRVRCKFDVNKLLETTKTSLSYIDTKKYQHDNAYAKLLLVQCKFYYSLQKYKKALDIYKAMLSNNIGRSLFYFWVNYATILQKSNEPKKAVKILHVALSTVDFSEEDRKRVQTTLDNIVREIAKAGKQSKSPSAPLASPTTPRQMASPKPINITTKDPEPTLDEVPASSVPVSASELQTPNPAKLPILETPKILSDTLQETNSSRRKPRTLNHFPSKFQSGPERIRKSSGSEETNSSELLSEEISQTDKSDKVSSVPSVPIPAITVSESQIPFDKSSEQKIQSDSSFDRPETNGNEKLEFRTPRKNKNVAEEAIDLTTPEPKTRSKPHQQVVTPKSAKEKCEPASLKPPTKSTTESSTPKSKSSRDERDKHSVKKTSQRTPKDSSGLHFQELTVHGRKYHCLGIMGKGGSSRVIKAIGGRKMDLFAIKQVDLTGQDEQTCEAFKNEIHLLCSLKGESHIVHLYDYEITNKRLSLVLEMGEIDLRHLLIRLKKQIPTANRINYIKLYWQQMLEAVQVIHEKRIVHGDLKPANFVSFRGVLKLIDFGIAGAIQSNTTNIKRDSMIGTLNYIAPEALDLNPNPKISMGVASDVWSLGIILYEMAYGNTPFASITNMLLKVQTIVSEDCKIEFKDIGQPLLVDVLQQCLIRQPKQRATIAELLEHPFLL